jgi:hypothetical protein
MIDMEVNGVALHRSERPEAKGVAFIARLDLELY